MRVNVGDEGLVGIWDCYIKVNWEMHSVNECPHKDRSKRLCVFNSIILQHSFSLRKLLNWQKQSEANKAQVFDCLS